MWTTICTAANAHDDQRGRLVGQRPRHHQPKGNGGKDDRQAESDRVALVRTVRLFVQMRVVIVMAVAGMIVRGVVEVSAHRSIPSR
ncbi:hypothetical protein ABIC16_002736 [Sphingomonas sp. PvP055]